MIIIPLIVATTIVTRCDDDQKSNNSITRELKIDDRFEAALARQKFADTSETLFKKLRLCGQQRMEDIQMPREIKTDARTKRHVMKESSAKNTTWHGRVFYTFNTSDPVVKKVFKLGVKIWSENTCIDFMEDKNAQDKVVVIKDVGCWSDVGRLGGNQLLSLADVCLTEGSAVHEIGHVLGLLHTMSRYDRDNFINIVLRNVKPQNIDDFEKVNATSADTYGLSYDYGSIMHYDELSCSANGQPTMFALDSHYQKTMGSDITSFSDIFMINEHYECNAKCNKSTSAKCTNEGFPHPRNCSVCICPGGYGGALCDQRPSGCGEELGATKEKQLVIETVGSGMGLRDHFDFCYYMITAPKGKKIEVEVLLISHGYENSGCRLGGIEIKAQKDQKMTGYRFCSIKNTGGPIVSISNRLPVILYSKLGSMQASFMYRYVD